MTESTGGAPIPQEPVRYWRLPEQPVAPAAGARIAGVGRRFLALLVDAIPVFVLFLVLIAGPVARLGQELAQVPVLPSGELDPSILRPVAVRFAVEALPDFIRLGVLCELGLLLWFAASWFAFGRTPGMALLGLRIVREEDGGRAGVGRVAVRYAGFLLGGALLLVGFAWALVDPRRQAWHDKLAGTIVVTGSPSPATPDAFTAKGPQGANRARRPSIGAVFDDAWSTYRSQAGPLFRAVGGLLVLAIVLLLPFQAATAALGQDALAAMLRELPDIISVALDPGAESHLVAASGPALRVSAGLALLGGPLGALLLAATAAARGQPEGPPPPGMVLRAVADRLPAVLAFGLLAGAAAAVGPLLTAAQLSAAATSPVPAQAQGLVGIGQLVGDLLAGPVLLLIALDALVVICLVSERLDPLAALSRVASLARGNLLWLVGLVVVIDLV
ncbi:MAG TPA: RDD family protein, partial [Candidatus Limnocylindrales bacterium]|nr:RDD family protein [Candidatus Limnocylindrales bacterium]